MPGEPPVGTVIDGYRFKGGNPRDRANWQPVAPPKLNSSEQRTLSQVNKAAEVASAEMREAERFREYNRDTWTTPFNGGAWGTIPRNIGRIFDPTDFVGMEAITARLAPQARVEGSGSTSNLDVSMFVQGGPSVDKPRSANNDIIDRAREETNRRQARAAFFDRWARDNNTLVGAQEAFNRSYQPPPPPGTPPASLPVSAGPIGAAGSAGARMFGRPQPNPAANAPRQPPRPLRYNPATGRIE